MTKTNDILNKIFAKTNDTHKKLDKFSDTLDSYWGLLQKLEKAYLLLFVTVVLIIIWPLLAKYLETIKQLYENSSPEVKLNLIFIIPGTALITLIGRWIFGKLSKKQKK